MQPAPCPCRRGDTPACSVGACQSTPAFVVAVMVAVVLFGGFAAAGLLRLAEVLA